MVLPNAGEENLNASKEGKWKSEEVVVTPQRSMRQVAIVAVTLAGSYESKGEDGGEYDDGKKRCERRPEGGEKNVSPAARWRRWWIGWR
jgi:hypothetical protein